ncbi:MAG TPA: hypothetical protein VHX68_00955 [Planctomycetaceae bacterium]|nr:hypothetical protein [Planctomycetaceae bacterium]
MTGEYRCDDGTVIKVGDLVGDDPLDGSPIIRGRVEEIWPSGSPDAVGSGCPEGGVMVLYENGNRILWSELDEHFVRLAK